jgi:pimeloyl-ACP methyl ester carboxylesterase
VILHGYGGAGVLFFPVMKKLSKYFNLIFVDTIGMAGSSRPDNYKLDFTP